MLKILVLAIVGNKAKGRISKRVFQENKTPNFPKNKHFLPPDTHNEIRSFALLTTQCLTLEPGANLFEEFMQLYSHHPHSADVFELIGQYEEVSESELFSDLILNCMYCAERSRCQINLLSVLFLTK